MIIVAQTSGAPRTVEARFDNLVVTAVPPAPAAGSALVADNFEDPARGLVEQRPVRAYDSGEYLMKKTDMKSNIVPAVRLPGEYSNSSIAVDARLVGEAAERTVGLGCRARPLLRPPLGRAEGYRLLVEPAATRFTLIRMGEGGPVPLAEWQPSDTIASGERTNRIQLGCVGSTITGAINSVVVVSVDDDVYTDGELLFGANIHQPPGPGLTVEARFDNLVVTAGEPRGDPMPAPAQVPRPRAVE
jgi:hypothetical protein